MNLGPSGSSWTFGGGGSGTMMDCFLATLLEVSPLVGLIKFCYLMVGGESFSRSAPTVGGRPPIHLLSIGNFLGCLTTSGSIPIDRSYAGVLTGVGVFAGVGALEGCFGGVGCLE